MERAVASLRRELVYRYVAAMGYSRRLHVPPCQTALNYESAMLLGAPDPGMIDTWKARDCVRSIAAWKRLRWVKGPDKKR